MATGPASSKKASGDSGSAIKSVEIKVTVRPDQELRALRAFKVDEDTAEVRIICFYDTPRLELFDGGVVLRSRLVKGDEDDTTVKIRPVIPSKVPPSWARVRGFKIEADRTGRKVVRSASLTQPRKRSEIDAVADGKHPVRELFSEAQLGLIMDTSKCQIDFDELKPLGPIRVLCWQTAHKGFPYKMTIEEWRLPDGEDLVEVSIKVSPDQEAEAKKRFDQHLKELGIDPNGAQETKTRTAVEYFAKALRSHKKQR
jgi:hypothetical protein